jgi:hypothetical protein
VPEEIPASYADTGERCTVSVRTLDSRPPRRTFAVGGRPIVPAVPGPHRRRGRVIRADVPGVFGGF